MSLLQVISGLILLVAGGNFLVRSSVSLSFKMKLSRLVIGMTVVSFATSAPELIVSVQAAWSGHSDLALSNVIGSNIANIALVLGVTAIIIPLPVNREFFMVNWPKMMLISVLLYLFLLDSKLSAVEGVVLLLSLIVFLVILVVRARKMHLAVDGEVDEKLASVPGWKVMLWLVSGGVALWYGSELLISGATRIAEHLGVDEAVIGVSMVALGTSIPELAASVIAAVKKEDAISLGNLLGSNIFNIGSVLGITSLIKPVTPENAALLHHDIYWMLGISLILAPLALLPSKNRFYRWEGILLVVLYGVFIIIKYR